jgi:hypothetical protein
VAVGGDRWRVEKELNNTKVFLIQVFLRGAKVQT